MFLAFRSRKFLKVQSALYRILKVRCDWSTRLAARSSRRSLGRKDCATSQKNVCVGGYLRRRLNYQFLLVGKDAKSIQDLSKNFSPKAMCVLCLNCNYSTTSTIQLVLYENTNPSNGVKGSRQGITKVVSTNYKRRT